MMLLSIAVAIGGDDRPPPPKAAPGDCIAVEALRPGTVTRTCASISVPPADYADLLAAEVWGEHIADVRRLEAAACADSLAAAAAREDYWRSVAEHPAPALPPAAWLGFGLAGGVVLTVGAGWALGQVAH